MQNLYLSEGVHDYVSEYHEPPCVSLDMDAGEPLTGIFDLTSAALRVDKRSSRGSARRWNSFSQKGVFEGLAVPSVESLYNGLTSLSLELEGMRAHSRARRSSTPATPLFLTDLPCQPHRDSHGQPGGQGQSQSQSLGQGQPSSHGQPQPQGPGGASPSRRATKERVPPSQGELPPLRRLPSLAAGGPASSSGAATADVAIPERVRSGRIKVVVRKRPFHREEAGTDCVSIQPPNIQLSITKQRVDLSEYHEINNFIFDGVFDETVTNAAIYASCGRELLEEALKGGSSSFFACGQTGSGKTYTMVGNDQEKGLYLLCAMELFQCLSPNHSALVSFYEIYCSSLYDLLNQRFPVILREDAKGRVNICGLSWHPATSVDELWRTMNTGLELRRTASTDANERSSRSHAVMTIRILDSNSENFGGRINFVDLAGSESAADAGNKDRRIRFEGAEINKSLLALKECIRALDEKRRYIPFRSSRLTEVLRDSFVGNCQTLIIANISPSSLNYEHTLNTLRYTFRVKGLTVPALLPCRARKPSRPAQPPPRGRGMTAPPPLFLTPGGRASRSRSRGRSHRRHAVIPDVVERRPPRGVTPAKPLKSSPPSRASPSPPSRLARRAVELNLREMEGRIRRKVMRQLQRDITKEIQQMLDQRDVMINRLSRENRELKEILTQHHGGGFPDANPHHFTLSPREISL